MSDKLKPCPFCGDEAAQYGSNGQPIDDWAQCYCGALDGRSVHASHWNIRPIEDALRAENMRLKTKLVVAEDVASVLEWIILVADEFADHLFKTGVLSERQNSQYESTRNKCRIVLNKWGE